MAAAWFVILLVLFPGVAAAQPSVAPHPFVPDTNVIINPRTAPPLTIPSAPELGTDLRLPAAPPGPERPTKTFELRPTLSLIEEYTDNFNRSVQGTSNFRSIISPGLLVLLDRGVLTGQASYRLSAFHDSSTQELGDHHALAAQLAWQATPRLKLTLAESFVKSDEPSQADRLEVSAGRREFTRNLLSLGSEYSIGTIETKAHYRLSTFTSDDQTTTAHAMGGTGSVPLGQIHLLTLGYEYLRSESTRESTRTPSSALVQGDSTTTGHELTGAFSREISATLTAGISAAFADREQTTAGGATNDFSRWQVAFFNTYIVPEKIVMRGSIGVAQLQSKRASNKLLLTSNSSLLYWFGPALVGLTVERGFSETFAQGENFGVVETSAILASLSYRFSPLLTAFVRGTYRENEFTGEGGGQAGRKDTITSGILGVSYQVLTWLTATFDYTYTKTTSSDADAGFSQNRVRAALNAAF
jgi:Putative beta-barrel porin 2